MNDNELDNRLREAFDSCEVPPSLQTRTREAIKALQDGLAAETSVSVNQPTTHQGEVIHPDFSTQLNHSEGGLPGEKKQNRRHLRNRFIGAIAACIVLIAALFGVVHIGTTPTAFVDIDINPSIELQVNRFDTVVEAEGLNEDGRNVLDGLHLEGLSFNDALETLASSNAMESYLTDDAFIAVSVSSNNQTQEQKLASQGESCLANLSARGSCDVVSLDFYEEAHAHNMGCGRYAAALELMELDHSITLDECAHLTMRQLRDRINQCHASESGESKAASGAGQHGGGYGPGDGSGWGNNSSSDNGGSNANGFGNGVGMHHGWHHEEGN